MQSVASEDCYVLAHFCVKGWLAPAEIVVINCGKVIVYETEAVDHFDRNSSCEGVFAVATSRLACTHRQDWPDPLAAPKECVAHRFLQLGHEWDLGQFLRKEGLDATEQFLVGDVSIDFYCGRHYSILVPWGNCCLPSEPL